MALGLEDKWYSSNLIASDGTRETNLILCVYDASLKGIDSTTKKHWAHFDMELHFTDHTGKEKPIPEASGGAFLSDHSIEFNPIDGCVFSHSMTNGVMTLDKLGCFAYDGFVYKVHIKAALKKRAATHTAPCVSQQLFQHRGSYAHSRVVSARSCYSMGRR